MEPAGAFAGEDGVPMDVAGAELRNGGVSAIGAAQRSADAESTFRKVQPVADGSADSVIGNPLDVRLVYATLKDQILNQAADGVVGKGGDHGGVQAEAAAQPASDVIFAAPFPNPEAARC